ncbi:MAG: hypothetical protein IPP71_21085 [Bacteroidetes bacterium]|nr:hypothetical protein [Bacteroidota bacterium]
MNKIVVFFLSFCMLGTIQGCYYDVEEELYPASNTNCDTTNVSYNSTIKPIMDASCNSCHSAASAQGGVVLDTYTTLKDYAISGALLGVVRQESGFSPMPKGGNKLNDCSISKIEVWVTNQYPEN